MTKDSRLERFLKALCSLDYSDLPTPLSRVEVLWNCLVTGEETPDFQPQSRTEKYLMSILGVYDLEDIPQPNSRAEVLLYKLATGDTDVKLEDGAKSRYERLLSEIVANGGVVGNVDFEYVTYVLGKSFNTLYNTAEKSVKSAILKGETLVNLINNQMYSYTQTGSSEKDGEYVTITSANETGTNLMIGITLKQPLEANTLYTLIYLDRGLAPKIILRDVDNAINFLQVENTGIKTFTTKENSTKNLTLYYCDVSVGQKYKHTNNVMIIKGDVSNLTFNNYFEGMQSVKMPVLTTTGKNLFDEETFFSNENCGFKKTENGFTTTDVFFASTFYPLQLKPNTTYSLGVTSSNPGGTLITIKTGGINVTTNNSGNLSPFTTDDTGIIEIRGGASGAGNIGLYNIQHMWIVEGNVKGEYEPYKSNSLTVNEPVELRGIGDVKDELNLITGELLQRTEEIMLNGGSKVNTYSHSIIPSTHQGFFYKGVNHSFDTYKISNCISNYDLKLLSWSSNGNIYGYVNKSLLESEDLTGLKNFFDNNVVKVVGIKVQSAIKTVDLTTLDQNGKETKLKTFDDITHVSLSSEGLIPEAEMIVVTKNLDDISQASTMSLRMNYISDRQNELQNEVDTQSESIDSTMMATTEIYEQTL